MENWKNPPLVMSGLVLGLAALGNLLGAYWLPFRFVLGSIALLLYLILIFGMIRHPKEVKKQLYQPLVASVFPTFFMSGMLFATYLQQLLGLDFLARALWWLSFLGNGGLILFFFWNFTWHFRWEFVFPSWSVLYVGIAVSGLTASVSGAYEIGQFVFWYGLVATIVVLPFMAIRAYRIGLPEAIKPNISTFCAPVSLLLASYINTFPQQIDFRVVWILLLVSQMLYVFVLCQVPNLLRRPFNPGFSAFTFPFVISATSLKLSVTTLKLPFPYLFGVGVETGVATLLVCYVFWQYLLYLRQKAT